MGPLLFLVLVSTGPGTSRLSDAMEQAVRQVLGTAGDVIVEERPPEFSDREAVNTERRLHARAVARISVSAETSSQEIQVEIRIHRANGPEGSAGWITRVVGFSRTTDLAEVGRAAGYTMLTMLPDVRPPSGAAQAPPPQAPGPPPAVAPHPQTVLSTDNDASKFSIDVFGIATAALEGGGGGAGGGLRLGWRLSQRAAVSAGMMGRTGDIDGAQATASTLGLLLGAAFTPVSSRWFSLALRLEALAGLALASRAGANQESTRQWRWLPAGRATIEAAARVSPKTQVFLAAGLEQAAGHTDVFVDGEKRAVLASRFALAELGIRIPF